MTKRVLSEVEKTAVVLILIYMAAAFIVVLFLGFSNPFVDVFLAILIVVAVALIIVAWVIAIGQSLKQMKISVKAIRVISDARTVGFVSTVLMYPSYKSKISIDL